MSTEPVEPRLYRGEPAPRRPLLAFALTLLCPGFGAAYLGRPLAGTLLNLLFVSAAGLFVVCVTALKFFPGFALLVFAAGWFGFALMLATDAAVEARRRRDEYVLDGTNHPLIYTLMALGTLVLPLVVLAQYTERRLWTVVSVESDVMYPTLRAGDEILIDRTAYLGRAPNIGELVAFVASDGEQPVLARVVGGPGDEVEVVDAEPWVNGAPLPRSAVTGSTELGEEPALAAYLGDGAPSPDGLVTFSELNRGVGYFTADDGRHGVGAVFEPVVLAEGEYYLLFDNRQWLGAGEYGDSRGLGPVGVERIVGRPLYVAYSAAEDGPTWARVGRRVQPQPL